jgi:transcriptional regulator with XRE-family HTH domain
MANTETSNEKLEQGKRVKLIRNMTGLNQAEFAQKHDIGLSTLKFYELGLESGLTEKGANKIIAAARIEGISCTTAWLMLGVGEPPKFTGILREKDKAVLTKGSLPENTEKTIIHTSERNLKQELDLFYDITSDAVTMRITDNSMEPEYCMGDYVGGQFLHGNDIEQAIEQDCIIKLEDGNYNIVRRLSKGNGSGLYNAYCTNLSASAQYPPLVNIRIIAAAPIIRWWRVK